MTPRPLPILLALAVPLAAQAEPPIRIVVDIHMDPMYSFPASIRPQVYLQWITDTNAALDVLAPQGALISFLACGEFMEYVVDGGATGPGALFLQRIYGLGGQIGSHSHSERRIGPHQWAPFLQNATLAQSRQVWRDNVTWTDQAILLALGNPPPKPLPQIDSVRGSHLPATESEYHQLMAEFGFQVRQGGPEEDFYQHFTHYIYHPYRPSAANTIDEDLTAPFACVPQAAVIGVAGSHKGIYQDCTIEASKALLLQELISWRHAERTGAPDKIWVFGHGSHGSDLRPGSVTEQGWYELLRWLNARLVGKTTPRGTPYVAFDTQTGVANAYFLWEQANPGRSSHRYPATTQTWAHYPWLRPVAEELAGAHLKSEPALGAGIEAYDFDRNGTRVIALWSETGSGTVDLSSSFAGPVHVVDAETSRFLGADASAVPYGAPTVLVADGMPWTGIGGTPAIGQSVSLEMQGRPGDRGAFVVGAARTVVSLPPFGTLLVDLTRPHLVLDGVALDAAGAGRLGVTVPADPTLAGARLWVQAISYGAAGATLAQNVAALDLR